MEETKEFKIRNPKSTDIFTFIRILGKMKIKKEIAELAGSIATMNKKHRELTLLKQSNKNTTKAENELEEIETKIGMELPFIFAENMDKAEDEVIKLFSDLIGVSEDEYRKMDADITIDIIFEIKNNEKFAKVFTKALSLLK